MLPFIRKSLCADRVFANWPDGQLRTKCDGASAAFANACIRNGRRYDCLQAGRGRAVYEGHFVDGRREGCGSVVAADGSVYLGAWRDDLMWGPGATSAIFFCSVCMPPHLGPTFDTMENVWLDWPIAFHVQHAQPHPPASAVSGSGHSTHDRLVLCKSVCVSDVMCWLYTY